MSEHIAEIAALLSRLERRGVITTDPSEATECCGILRDEDGFCWHRPGHPIYAFPTNEDGE